MIKVTVIYPWSESARFDSDYYVGKHIPLVQSLLGPALKKAEVDLGVAGGAPGSPPLYVALAHLHFESTAAFQAAFAPHAEKIMADVPNYTDIQPGLQISDALASGGA